jgi:hypothetical protein
LEVAGAGLDNSTWVAAAILSVDEEIVVVNGMAAACAKFKVIDLPTDNAFIEPLQKLGGRRNLFRCACATALDE